ncbi:MAG: amino acid--tRNA ligase-related protein [Planctomycetota bacterium]|jgi:aspartyl-tRNA synthetase
MSATAKPRGGGAPAKSPFATGFRTHTCGELGKAHVGQQVKLCGSVESIEDNARFCIRDTHGSIQVRLGEKATAALVAQLFDDQKTPEEERRVTPETVVTVPGVVKARKKPGKGPTGAVYVAAEDVIVESLAKAPLLFDFRDKDISLWNQVRHRYLYLRAPAAHEAFRFRTRVVAALRRALVAKGFDEVRTPLLSNRWTPGAPEAFLAIQLPGTSPIHGPMLMASGFDRAFEVARRFARQPSYSAWEQPEFTMLDANLAYVGEEDVVGAANDLLAVAWQEGLGKKLDQPIEELRYEDAIARYGTDSPDLRFELELKDVTGAAQTGGAAVAFCVPGGAAKRGALDGLAALTSEASGVVTWFSATGAEAPGVTPADAEAISESGRTAVAQRVGAAAGDLVVCASSGHALTAGQLARQRRACVERRAAGRTSALHDRAAARARQGPAQAVSDHAAALPSVRSVGRGLGPLRRSDGVAGGRRARGRSAQLAQPLVPPGAQRGSGRDRGHAQP